MYKMPLQVAVVGAGVVGLSTAVRIQNVLPAVQVTIISDKFAKETTSDGAAGIFRPTTGKTPGVPLHVLKGWLRDSWQHYHSLAHSPDAGEAGVQVLSGYRFVNNPKVNEIEAELCYTNRRLNEDEMKIFPGNARKYKYGWFVTTLLTEPRKYMPFLMKQFRLNGGRVINKKLLTFEELVGQYTVVVNCTAFGSRELLGDNKLVPIRGQVFKVRAPWIKHSVHVGDAATCYILPGLEYVTVGGTRQENTTDCSVRSEDSKKIWEDACSVLPSLRNAEIVREWAGLRPHREPLRLEAETMTFPSGPLQVVHNYGHGAEGVSLSWGTACNAATLVQQIVARAKL